VTRLAAGAAAVLCLSAAVALHAAGDAHHRLPVVDRPDLLYVRSPAAIRRLALGYDGFLADVYWIRALQHFGGERIAPPDHVRNYSLLYPLLDLATTLDPNFNIAYRFGSIFLGEPYPGGPGRPDLAIALLRKGIAAQPQKWQYLQDLGFVYYWHLQDYKTAAAWFERASEVPGAPSWLRPLAAVTLAEGGHRSASRTLFQQLAQSEEPWLRGSAERRLRQLDALDMIDAVQAHVTAYQRTHPGEPVTWGKLIADGVLPSVPIDSSGTPLVITAEGHVTISRESGLFPLPGQNPDNPS
jgi:tetratricopeptide (TPR) repeat protein